MYPPLCPFEATAIAGLHVTGATRPKQLLSRQNQTWLYRLLRFKFVGFRSVRLGFKLKTSLSMLEIFGALHMGIRNPSISAKSAGHSSTSINLLPCLQGATPKFAIAVAIHILLPQVTQIAYPCLHHSRPEPRSFAMNR